MFDCSSFWVKKPVCFQRHKRHLPLPLVSFSSTDCTYFHTSMLYNLNLSCLVYETSAHISFALSQLLESPLLFYSTRCLTWKSSHTSVSLLMAKQTEWLNFSLYDISIFSCFFSIMSINSLLTPTTSRGLASTLHKLTRSFWGDGFIFKWNDFCLLWLCLVVQVNTFACYTTEVC